MKHSLHLRILDQQVHLRTDSAALTTWISHLYSRFCTTPTSPSLEILVNSGVDQIDLEPGGSNAALRLTLHNLPIDQQADIVLRATYAHVESHLLFHGGVLAVPSADQDAAGVALVGPTGHGKTTLTLELGRRGWGFLSDEIAALEVSTGVLWPFPRALRPRAGTLDLLGLTAPTAEGSPWFDIDQIIPGTLNVAVPLRFLFLLESDLPAPTQTTLWLSLSHIEPHLLAALKKLDAVIRVEVDSTERRLRIQGHDLTQNEIYYRIEEICRAQHSRILDLSVQRAAPPTFQTPPQITAISPADATLALLPHLQSGRRSRLWYGPWQGSPLALFRTLATRLHGVTCFRLSVGPLTATANLIEQSVNRIP
ncbi:hypothetical protein GC175_11380 [bacterium]|nr:hypothetical protein [bacterium]